MPYTKNLVIFSLFSFLLTISISTGYAVTLADYELAVSQKQKISVKGLSMGDGKDLDAFLYKPAGEGPFPALVALHGAGGIFPYQLWWAKEISKWGYVVLFVDHYCSRGHLCEPATHTEDGRGHIMRNWEMVSIRQRVIDAAAAHISLSNKSYVKKDSIGLIGWSWGGASALFAQKITKVKAIANGGFKATIAFYPNLKHFIDNPKWIRSGPLTQPTLILYGEWDTLESGDSYQRLLSSDYPAAIKVVGFDGAYKKFDELGPYRERHHPGVGIFFKGFQKNAFNQSVMEIKNFLTENLR